MVRSNCQNTTVMKRRTYPQIKAVLRRRIPKNDVLDRVMPHNLLKAIEYKQVADAKKNNSKLQVKIPRICQDSISKGASSKLNYILALELCPTFENWLAMNGVKVGGRQEDVEDPQPGTSASFSRTETRKPQNSQSVCLESNECRSESSDDMIDCVSETDDCETEVTGYETALEADSGSEKPRSSTSTPGPRRRRRKSLIGKRTKKVAKKITTKKQKPASLWSVKDAKGKDLTKSKISFSFYVKEDHNDEIYGCSFYHGYNNDVDEDQPQIFATVGGRFINIYECVIDGSMNKLKTHIAPEEGEVFYCCAWSNYCIDFANPILAVGGKSGTVRIFAHPQGKCLKHLHGHDGPVNDIMFNKYEPNLLVTASQDKTVRLWNVKTEACVVIFGGARGHQNEVIALDLHMTRTDQRLVTSGSDGTVKIWLLNKKEISEAIKKSFKVTPNSTRVFPTVMQERPDFSTRPGKIHGNYVDCAKWFGNAIFSKSVENEIILWKPGNQTSNSILNWVETLESVHTRVILKLPIKKCELWFMKFAIHFGRDRCRLAIGNCLGEVYLFDWNTVGTAYFNSTKFDKLDENVGMKLRVLKHENCRAVVRQMSFSRNGRILVGVCDDTTVWRWNIEE